MASLEDFGSTTSSIQQVVGAVVVPASVGSARSVASNEIATSIMPQMELPHKASRTASAKTQLSHAAGARADTASASEVRSCLTHS